MSSQLRRVRYLEGKVVEVHRRAASGQLVEPFVAEHRSTGFDRSFGRRTFESAKGDTETLLLGDRMAEQDRRSLIEAAESSRE